jgi:4-hydroxy-tetrahydrodipicolinate synthase
MTSDWQGVFPAACTHFHADQSLDLKTTAAHLEAMIQAGIHGLVMIGTVGENPSLTMDEKLAVLRCGVETAAGRIPVLAGVAESSTAEAARFAKACESAGANGLMVLPALVYKADAREALTHFRTVARASSLPVMIYNNPPTYGVDVTPEMFVELADEPTVVAIKESSDDVRRLTDIVNAVGDRYQLFAGVDDLMLESIMLGAVGVISGLVNAFPVEQMAMWDLAQAGRWEEARAIYRWYMPLLHLDTHSKLVQYIKLAVAECGYGSEMVRAPRLILEGDERAEILKLIEHAKQTRPDVANLSLSSN